MNYFLITLSLVLISISAIDSPIAILKDWNIAELLRVVGIFFFLSSLNYFYKRFNVANGWLILVLVLVILTHFDIVSLVALGLISFTAAVIGGSISSRSKTKWIGSEDITINISVGYALILGVVQVTAHFPVNTKELVAIACIAILFLLRGEAKSLLVRMWRISQEPYSLPSMTFILPAGVALCMLVFVAMPETHSDALIANLRIAHQMQVNGLWPFDAAVYSWAYFPKGAAWLQTIHYLIAGESGARLFNWFAIIITSLMVYKEVARLGFANNIGYALALFLSTPITFWCGFVLFDDAVFGMFFTATIIAAVNSSKSLAPSGIFITLLLSSAAIATKITGLIIIPVILSIYVCRFILEKKAEKAIQGGWIKTDYLKGFIPFIFIGAFSYFVAYLKTGNPVLPIYNDIFKSPFFLIVRLQDLRWSQAIGWDFIYYITSSTSKFMEGRNWTFGVQNALFFIPLVYELISRRKNTTLILYAIGLVVFATLVFTQMHYARYLYPIFPIFTIFTASVLCRFDSRIGKLFTAFLLIAAIAINLINVKSLNMYYSFDFKSMAPVETRSFTDYFEKSLNQTVNFDYGPSAKVLYLHRPYGTRLEGVALINHWASPIIKKAIDGVNNSEDALVLIKKFNLTHFIVDEEIMKIAPSSLTKSLNSVANLQRQVGSAQLWKVDERLVTTSEVIKLNDNSSKPYLLSGWRSPEHWGTWAFGAGSELTVCVLNPPTKNPVHVKILAMPYNPPGRAEPLRVKIAANGHPLKEIVLLPLQQPQAMNFAIPAKFIGEDGVIKLTFQFPEPFDNSKLQLGLIEMSFEYK